MNEHVELIKVLLDTKVLSSEQKLELIKDIISKLPIVYNYQPWYPSYPVQPVNPDPIYPQYPQYHNPTYVCDGTSAPVGMHNHTTNTTNGIEKYPNK